MRSDFLGLDIDLDELSATVAATVGIRYRLTPLAVKCTYPVFRGEAEGAAPVFVKIGTEEEWRKSIALLRDIGTCGLFAPFVSDRPIVYGGHVVFVTEWRETRTVFPEDFTDAQAESFVCGCARLSAALQNAHDYLPLAESPNDPERLYGVVAGYARRHPIAGRLLKALVSIPKAERTYAGHTLAVVHGDFHAKNFGLDGDELASVYDFDKLTQGLACGDFVNALVERFSCHHLSSAARRRLKDVTRKVVAAAPWPREELIIAANVLRLWFAARRIEKHPNSPWVAIDILRRDRKIREFLAE